MASINVLNKQVAELIAAGEVIERPASVIKELVENAIDAHADRITVEIKNGGITFMRVTDNGIGIEQEDIRKAFLRHATSKIAVSDDLDSIATLGFRGEALASICAVAKVELMTKHQKEANGTLYRIEGGEEKELKEIGCPQGTTFIIRDLFYNVPARMKFLKKDTSESTNIATLMDRIALSHPEIGFTLIRDGRQVMKTMGNGDLQTAILQVFGRQFASSLIPVSYEHEGVRMSGYTSTPVSANRASRAMQIFFVNGRYVRTKTAIAAMEQAYKGFIMVGKYPACVLSLEMNCSTLDVNVHPAKLEIRFTNERPVYECVYYGVKTAVSEYDTRQNHTVPKEFVTTDPKVMGRTADRGSQLSFAYGKDHSAEEPEIFMPAPSSYGTVTLHDPAAAASRYREGIQIRPIHLNDTRKPFPVSGSEPSTDDPKPVGKVTEEGAGKILPFPAVASETESVPHTDISSADGEQDTEAVAVSESPEQTSQQVVLPALSENPEVSSVSLAGQDIAGQTQAYGDGISMPNEPEIQNSSEITAGNGEEAGNQTMSLPSFSDSSEEPSVRIVDSEERGVPRRYIGEAFAAYLIFEYGDDRLMFIDKHAAHERLIYERLKRQPQDYSPQMLIEPIAVTLDKSECQAVMEHREMLADIGFEVDEFGSGTILIRSVPIFLEKLEITEAFSEIARYLKLHKKIVLSEKMEWIYQNTACRAAIKAGNQNRPEELLQLAMELEQNPEVQYCPHGRPIYFFLSKNEIEKGFKRI